MRRFRFRLERLLAIRRYVEREWELELARATSVVLATRAGIASAEEGIARSYEVSALLAPSGAGLDRGSAAPGGPGALLDGGAVAVAETYRAGMAARIRMLGVELVRQEAELETVRDGYLEASRSRKVLDKLKERQGEAVRVAQNREEIAVLNDIATSRASRWE